MLPNAADTSAKDVGLTYPVFRMHHDAFGDLQVHVREDVLEYIADTFREVTNESVKEEEIPYHRVWRRRFIREMLGTRRRRSMMRDGYADPVALYNHVALQTILPKESTGVLINYPTELRVPFSAAARVDVRNPQSLERIAKEFLKGLSAQRLAARREDEEV